MNTTTHDIVPTHLVVKAMRDNGYKNAAYAIAELIDNAIQAGATSVELLCAERSEFINHRQRSRISEIAVLDNGCGMDADILRMALQFGNGTRLDDRSGIGRFGMGLPNSSISQAQRVDVWSWQDGVENAIHTYLDIREIEQGTLTQVPTPTRHPLPEIWLRTGKTFGPTGTLVAWSHLDRVVWRSARAIIENSEQLIGRMYRYFLDRGRTTIRMVAFDIDGLEIISLDRFARPNDPLYLMHDTACPPPYNNAPMFELWGKPLKFDIEFAGATHEVIVTCSYAKEEARTVNGGINPGSLPHGRHAKENLGVSIVRAGRELDLDAGWAIAYDPVERWWGVEVSFPPALDELFGVTNNKQSARNFSALAKQDVEALIGDHHSYTSAREANTADADPTFALWEIANHINRNVNSLRRLLKAQTKGTRSNKRHETPGTEEKGTKVTRKRAEDGYEGISDHQERTLTPDQRSEEITQALIEQGARQSEAKEIAARTISRSLKYTVTTADLASPAFFDVKSRGGAIMVTLNIRHPAYLHLVELLEQDTDTVEEGELRNRLSQARDGLELLIMAWARYEDEQPDGKRRDLVQQTRWDWGRVAAQFLDHDL